MEIICPKCNFMQNVPDEKIPPKAEKATCPKCGEKFQFRTVQPEFHIDEEPSVKDQEQLKRPDPEPTGEKNAEDDSIWSRLESMGGQEQSEAILDSDDSLEQGYEVPWENLDEHGFFPGFIETIKRAMLAPSAFFYKMPLKGFVMPLAFFLLVSVIQALGTFIWNMAGVFPTTAQHDASGLGMGMMGIGSFFIVIVYPFFMGVWLFVAAGVTHLFLMLFQSGRAGFEGTFRATAYGSAPMVLGLLPFIGPIIGAAWSLGITIIGYKQIHESTYMKVIMAMLTPIVLVIVMAALFY
ncbi:YIP1 family protein [Desulfonatronovibrio magnus]|uniref:YIP1 family protein n=1 Tax=Desulfonatronovibrio magnus TaxID=698827 RepID=UPI0005EB9171|nr:YIP1 family protein [Desulfonatronovibrio magnus]